MTKKKAIVYFALAALILILFILIFIKGHISNTKAIINNVKRLNVIQEITPLANDSLILFDNGMLIEAEGANIKARDIEGKALWSLRLEDDIKDLSSCGLYLIVTTESNNIVVINNQGKKLWQYEMLATPASILNDGNQFFLIQYNWPNNNTFEIFNVKGVRSCSGIIDNSHILSFSVSAGQRFTISLMDISSDRVLSKIATYNNKGEILWANNYEDILVSRTKYGAKDNVIIGGETFIKKFKPDGKLVKELTFTDAISNIEISDSLIIVVTKKNNYYEIYSYDFNLKQQGAFAVKEKPTNIFVGNDDYLLFDKDNLTLLNKQGEVIAFYESNVDINDAYIHWDKSIYIISNRKLLKLSYVKR